jgi:hypothetical protein
MRRMSPADEPRSGRDLRHRRPSQAPRRQTPHRTGPRRPPQVGPARLRCRLHRAGSAGTTSFPGVPDPTRDFRRPPVSRCFGQQVPRHNSPRSRPRRRQVSSCRGRTSEANDPRLRSGRPLVTTSVPFNCHASVRARRQHAVQHIALSDYDYSRLRQEFPGQLERNHQGVGSELIAGLSPRNPAGRVCRRPRLGGLLNYYERAV